MPVEVITDLSDPRLLPFRDVKRVPPSRVTGRLIAEGPTVAERVFRSGVPVESVLISERKLDSFGDRIPPQHPTYQLPHRLAQELTGFSFHGGVLVHAQRPEPPRLEDVIPNAGAAFVLIGERVADPENVGALIRIGAAFGADAVIFGPGSADPFSRRVLRVSMGNGLFTPILESDCLAELLTELRARHELTLSAAVLDCRSQMLDNVVFPARSAIILGHEFEGITLGTLSHVDARVCIPMSNGTDSLNVAVAAGIFSFQYRSQNRVAEGAMRQEPASLSPSDVSVRSEKGQHDGHNND